MTDRTYYLLRHVLGWNRQFGQIRQYHRNQDKIKQSTISNKTLHKALKVVVRSTTILLDIYTKQNVMNIMISLKPTVTIWLKYIVKAMKQEDTNRVIKSRNDKQWSTLYYTGYDVMNIKDCLLTIKWISLNNSTSHDFPVNLYIVLSTYHKSPYHCST